MYSSDNSPIQPISPLLLGKWPAPIDQNAFYGPLGEITQAIEPHTEADPIAILIHLIVAFGNVIGRSAHFSTEADKHFLNTFAVLVGVSSKGRKGTSSGYMKKILIEIDPAWTAEKIQSGLSSGEGLIWGVRDEIFRSEPIKEKGKVVDYQNVKTDPGIKDKRLLVLESEFASTLHVIGREGNTLSALVRQAWDSGTLRTLTKNCPTKATDAHISIIGHITGDELRRCLDKTETANGFANRFLWVCVKRSKILSEGGLTPDLSLMVDKIRASVQFATHIEEMKRDNAAKELWHQIYHSLSAEKPGLIGALTARSEAQVMRLACIYALSNCSSVVTVDHLKAAMALWDYVDASIEYIFGNSLGDPITDTILSALSSNANGLSRTEISGLFKGHVESAQITRALKTLQALGLAFAEEKLTAGRTKEMWFESAKKENFEKEGVL